MSQALRPSELTRLTSLLESPAPGLSILSISGPGGVGKSYLVREALAALGPDAGWLTLSTDGASPTAREDLFALLDGLFRRHLPPPADPRRDPFPRLREVAAFHRELERAVVEELRTQKPSLPEETLVALLRAGRVLNAPLTQPASKVLHAALPLTARVAIGAIGALGAIDEEEARSLMRQARALKEQTVLPGPLRDALGITRRNRIKTDLYRLLAEELVADLTALLVDSKSRAKGARPRRLLLILDDYEALADLLNDFLLGALVPELAAASFSTLLLVVGRDDLEATHPGWAQHARPYLLDPIRLHPLDRAESDALLAEAGVAEERRAALFEATQGYPFLLALAAEEASSEDGQSALFLRQFFERTTRWMTPTEQDWFGRVCYLDRVNEDELRKLFAPEEVAAVQAWFERESSIRDPSAPVFRVRPLLRDKVLRYFELRSPSRHAEMVRRAAAPADPA